jgi:hypothetical protein
MSASVIWCGLISALVHSVALDAGVDAAVNADALQ